ncbi:MAG TPA: 2-phospho-L-lactate transferase [Candidatus Limnocylindrales bacterium]|nr:2-phospho-L-lactate transferase [Candidatus Limnocylindrales bacterium]
MKLTLLAGGTGGTKLAHGFAILAERVELTVIANVGDDMELHGLHVSPDVDALLYTLGGLIDTERGWGVRGDTFTAHAMLERFGAPAWFTVGDADLATHVERTKRLRGGDRLTDVTAAMAAALGIRARILPATDERHRTLIETDEGVIDFQDYFVRLGQRPEVRGVRFDGDARASAEALEAIRDAELIVIGPSNPIVSIGPILELPGMRDALIAAGAPKLAVSPIIGGRALKGPADRMLASLGHESSSLGVARLYAGLIDRFVLDTADAPLAPAIGELGMAADVLPSVMRTDADRAALAAGLLALAGAT